MDNKNDIIYRADVPVWFYIKGTAVAFLPVILFLLKINSSIVLGSLVIVLLVWGNIDNYIIEVYPDHFKLILPSFPINFYKKGIVYYYDSMSDYSFEKGEYNIWSTVFLDFIIGSLFPAVYVNFSKPNSMEFNYEEGGVVRSVKKRFSLSQTKQVIEANRHIQEMMTKHHNRSSQSVIQASN